LAALTEHHLLQLPKKHIFMSIGFMISFVACAQQRMNIFAPEREQRMNMYFHVILCTEDFMLRLAAAFEFLLRTA